MHHIEGSATLAAVLLKTDKIEGNYGARPSAKLYTVTCLLWGEETNLCRYIPVSVKFFSDRKQSEQ